MKNMCFLILKDVSKFKAPTIVCAGIAISEIIIKFAFPLIRWKMEIKITDKDMEYIEKLPDHVG